MARRLAGVHVAGGAQLNYTALPPAPAPRSLNALLIVSKSRCQGRRTERDGRARRRHWQTLHRRTEHVQVGKFRLARPAGAERRESCVRRSCSAANNTQMASLANVFRSGHRRRTPQWPAQPSLACVCPADDDRFTASCALETFEIYMLYMYRTSRLYINADVTFYILNEFQFSYSVDLFILKN